MLPLLLPPVANASTATAPGTGAALEAGGGDFAAALTASLHGVLAGGGDAFPEGAAVPAQTGVPPFAVAVPATTPPVGVVATDGPQPAVATPARNAAIPADAASTPPQPEPPGPEVPTFEPPLPEAFEPEPPLPEVPTFEPPLPEAFEPQPPLPEAGTTQRGARPTGVKGAGGNPQVATAGRGRPAPSASDVTPAIPSEASEDPTAVGGRDRVRRPSPVARPADTPEPRRTVFADAARSPESPSPPRPVSVTGRVVPTTDRPGGTPALRNAEPPAQVEGPAASAGTPQSTRPDATPQTVEMTQPRGDRTGEPSATITNAPEPSPGRPAERPSSVRGPRIEPEPPAADAPQIERPPAGNTVGPEPEEPAADVQAASPPATSPPATAPPVAADAVRGPVVGSVAKPLGPADSATSAAESHAQLPPAPTRPRVPADPSGPNGRPEESRPAGPPRRTPAGPPAGPPTPRRPIPPVSGDRPPGPAESGVPITVTAATPPRVAPAGRPPRPPAVRPEEFAARFAVSTTPVQTTRSAAPPPPLEAASETHVDGPPAAAVWVPTPAAPEPEPPRVGPTSGGDVASLRGVAASSRPAAPPPAVVAAESEGTPRPEGGANDLRPGTEQPPVAAASADLPPPADAADAKASRLAASVADTVRESIETGVRPLRARLDPPGLGHVTVEADRTDGRLSVRLTFESPEAAKLAAENLPALRESLAARGHERDAVDVRIDVAKADADREPLAESAHTADRGEGRSEGRADARGEARREAWRRPAESPQPKPGRQDPSGEPAPRTRRTGDSAMDVQV